MENDAVQGQSKDIVMFKGYKLTYKPARNNETKTANSNMKMDFLIL